MQSCGCRVQVYDTDGMWRKLPSLFMGAQRQRPLFSPASLLIVIWWLRICIIFCPCRVRLLNSFGIRLLGMFRSIFKAFKNKTLKSQGPACSSANRTASPRMRSLLRGHPHRVTLCPHNHMQTLGDFLREALSHCYTWLLTGRWLCEPFKKSVDTPRDSASVYLE